MSTPASQGVINSIHKDIESLQKKGTDSAKKSIENARALINRIRDNAHRRQKAMAGKEKTPDSKLPSQKSSRPGGMVINKNAGELSGHKSHIAGPVHVANKKTAVFGKKFTPTVIDKDKNSKAQAELESVNMDNKIIENAPVAPSIGVHRIAVTVSEPDHPMVTKRGETLQKFVRVTSNDKDHAIERGKKHFAKKGYKVHGAEHVGMIHEEHGAGEWGTDKLTNKYKNETPGQGISEVSSETLDRYKEKAKKSADELTAQGQHKKSNDRWLNIMKATGKQIDKTTANIKHALRKEEIELEEGRMGELHASISDHMDKHIDHYKKTGGAEHLMHKADQAAAKVSAEHGISHDAAFKHISDHIENRLNEEIEQIDEISSGLATSYLNKREPQHKPNMNTPETSNRDAKVAKGIRGAVSRVHGYGPDKGAENKVTGRFDYRKKVGATHTFNKEEVAANNVGGGEIAGTQGDAGKKVVMTKEPLKRKKLTDFKSFDEEVSKDPCWKNYKMVGMKDKDGKKVPNCVPKESVELDEYAIDAKGHKSSTGGLTQKGVDAYNRKTGGHLQTAVTTPPSKLDPDSKAAKRRKSFCARMSGVDGPMKDEKGRPTRKALALKKWNC